MCAFRNYLYCLLAVLLACVPVFDALADSPAQLSMADAIQLAVDRDSVLQQLTAEKTGIIASSVAAGALPDPKLAVGLENLPTDSFSVGREPMTMQIIGIQQDFPAGDTRALAKKRGGQLADLQQAAIDARRLEVEQAVRLAWLNAYYAEHAIALVNASESALEQSVAIAQTEYENGKGAQQAWLRARLALADTKARQIDFEDAERTAHSELVRWLGEDANRVFADSLPSLPMPPSYAALLDRLPGHPLLLRANQQIAADQTGVELARQTYKPMWGVNLVYGHRPGTDATGQPYTDMVSAMVTLSLPLFTDNRQDQNVVSARSNLLASTYARDDDLRRLKQRLDDDWAHWRQLKELNALYAQTVLPDAAADVTSGLNAYGNGDGDFFEVIRAQLGDLEARLRALRIQVDTEALKVQFLYLAGDQS
ncbi:MAG: TolC family protein [Gammaproteobacteria bacterium]|nr:TolC family protein [Gammaproteobacteria bacterium]